MRFLILGHLILSVLATSASFAQEASPPPSGGAMPDILDCNQLSWIQNCTILNTQLQRNPSAPMRIQNKEGHEFNFAPGTPSAMIEHMLLLTPQSAKKLADYYATEYAIADKAAALWSAEMQRRGGSLTGPLPSTMPAEPAPLFKPANAAPNPAAHQNVKLYVFYSSTCSACQSFLPHLSAYHKQHPDVFLSAMQIDHNLTALNSAQHELSLPAIELKGADLDRATKAVKSVPAIWALDVRTNRYVRHEGGMTADELERFIQDVGR